MFYNSTAVVITRVYTFEKMYELDIFKWLHVKYTLRLIFF